MGTKARVLSVLSVIVLSVAGCGSVAPGPSPTAEAAQVTTPTAATATLAPPSATAGPTKAQPTATVTATASAAATEPATAMPSATPSPTALPATVEEITFESGHFTLAGDLQIPAAGGMHAAVIMVHGDGGIDRTDSGKYRPIMDRFLRAGYAVFSWDKPGTGESTGEFEDGTWILTDRAAILTDAVELLKIHPAIDPQRIGLWGISQAGYVMPMALALTDDVAFMIVVSGPGVDSIDQTAYLIGQQLLCEGASESEARSAEQSFARMCKATTYQDYRDSMASLIEVPFARRFVGNEIRTEEDWLPWDRDVDAFFDPMPVIEQTTMPVLAFFGEEDTQVDAFQGAQAYQEALQEAGNRFSRVEILPQADHNLVLSETGCMSERDRRPAADWLNYAPGYLDAMEQWLVELSTAEEGRVALSEAEVATLSSLTQVDGYPFYVMHYQGGYDEYASDPRPVARAPGEHAWGCSLFAALGDPESRVYSRNFDWQYSPALLLFTDPPDGYASVSLQSVRFMGSYGVDATDLTNTTLEERYRLLYAPVRPYDGMNEAGLAIGMAAVPADGTRRDPAREDINMFTVMRQVLDHAATVDEAVAIMDRYNVLMESGPPVHYLVADATGRAVLVEYYEGEMVVLPNEGTWHAATNFFLTSAGDHPEDQCWRYARVASSLEDASGRYSASEAMALLRAVAQESTQWSVVYDLSTREADVVVGRGYSAVHSFRLGD